MALWAKVDVEMPTDGKLLGQPVVTRHLWTCLICLAKRQDEHGAIRGYTCALLAGCFNLPAKSVAAGLTYFQAAQMVELEVDGTIRLVNFDKRQGERTVAEKREGDRDRQERKRAVSRVTDDAVSRVTNGIVTSDIPTPVTPLEQSRAEEKRTEVEVEQKDEKKDLAQGAVALAPGASTPVFQAYSDAYRERYGEAAVRNAKVSRQLIEFVKRVGADEAPEVAAFYVGHNGSLYARAAHCVDLLLRDAEKLRMEWATGKQITGTEARLNDRTQANVDGWSRLLKGEKHGVG